MKMNNNNNLELGFDLEALLNKGKKKSFAKTEYLKQGTAFYRILPTFNPANRRLEHKYHFHWVEYTDENGKARKTTVQCTKYVEGFCPLCAAHDEAAQALKHAQENGGSEETIKRLSEASFRLQVSSNVYYNALNAANEVVLLALSSTVSKLLDAKLIEAVKDFNLDPTNPTNGLWFAFKKEGKGRESVTVDFKRTRSTVNGKIVEEIDQTPVAEDLAARLPELVTDLHDMSKVGIKSYTAAELADFLRGKPLPNKYKQNNSQAQQSQAEEDTSGEEPQGETVMDAINRAGTSLNTALNADRDQAASSMSAPRSAPISTDASAEIARLRGLSGKK
jgi:hypothetical protein